MHCAKSRTVIKAQRVEIQDKREGRTPTLATGSAIFSLDMSVAFDLVSQDYLIAALKFAQVGEDLINVVPLCRDPNTWLAIWAMKTH